MKPAIKRKIDDDAIELTADENILATVAKQSIDKDLLSRCKVHCSRIKPYPHWIPHGLNGSVFAGAAASFNSMKRSPLMPNVPNITEITRRTRNINQAARRAKKPRDVRKQ